MLQKTKAILHDKEFGLCLTLIVERNKHTDDFGQQKNLFMHAGALFAELIATRCPSTTRESISSLQKTSRVFLDGFQPSTHPFLFLCLPLGDPGNKGSCCFLNRNKNENKSTSLELVYTHTHTKNYQFQS